MKIHWILTGIAVAFVAVTSAESVSADSSGAAASSAPPATKEERSAGKFTAGTTEKATETERAVHQAHHRNLEAEQENYVAPGRHHPTSAAAKFCDALFAKANEATGGSSYPARYGHFTREDCHWDPFPAYYDGPSCRAFETPEQEKACRCFWDYEQKCKTVSLGSESTINPESELALALQIQDDIEKLKGLGLHADKTKFETCFSKEVYHCFCGIFPPPKCYTGTAEAVTAACAADGARCCDGPEACFDWGILAPGGVATVCEGSCRGEDSCRDLGDGATIGPDSCINTSGTGACFLVKVSVGANSCVGGDGICADAGTVGSGSCDDGGRFSCRDADCVGDDVPSCPGTGPRTCPGGSVTCVP